MVFSSVLNGLQVQEVNKELKMIVKFPGIHNVLPENLLQPVAHATHISLPPLPFIFLSFSHTLFLSPSHSHTHTTSLYFQVKMKYLNSLEPELTGFVCLQRNFLSKSCLHHLILTFHFMLFFWNF